MERPSGPRRFPAKPGRRQAFHPAMARAFREWSLGNQQPLWCQLPSVATPVHWICGERDRKFARLGREELRSSFRTPISSRRRNVLIASPGEWPAFNEWIESL